MIGQWYNLDITWDAASEPQNRYDYFMLTHEEFYTTHKKDDNIPEN